MPVAALLAIPVGAQGQVLRVASGRNLLFVRSDNRLSVAQVAAFQLVTLLHREMRPRATRVSNAVASGYACMSRVELRVYIGRGMFFYEDDIEDWFQRTAKTRRDRERKVD